MQMRILVYEVVIERNNDEMKGENCVDKRRAKRRLSEGGESAVCAVDALRCAACLCVMRVKCWFEFAKVLSSEVPLCFEWQPAKRRVIFEPKKD